MTYYEKADKLVEAQEELINAISLIKQATIGTNFEIKAKSEITSVLEQMIFGREKDFSLEHIINDFMA